MSKDSIHFRLGRAGILAAALASAAMLSAGPAWAANIITFGDNANACGSSVMCSTNGTSGYLNNGSGQAFDLSTISQWFQIDANGVNELSTQTKAEPDGGAGGFLVVNNTGATVHSWSISLTDNFTLGTPSVTYCSGSSGPVCDNFQANKGAAYGISEKLSGGDFFSCTNGTGGTNSCSSSAGQAAANFKPNKVTYTWYFGTAGIANGATFDISFASWNNNSWETPQNVPEPGSLALLGTALLGLGGTGLIRRRRKSAKA